MSEKTAARIARRFHRQPGKKSVYLCHPITGMNPDLVDKITRKGARMAFDMDCVPITSWRMWQQVVGGLDGEQYDTTLAACLELVDRSDEVWVLTDYITNGMRMEIERATASGKPVKFMVLDSRVDVVRNGVYEIKAEGKPDRELQLVPIDGMHLRPLREVTPRHQDAKAQENRVDIQKQEEEPETEKIYHFASSPFDNIPRFNPRSGWVMVRKGIITEDTVKAQEVLRDAPPQQETNEFAGRFGNGFVGFVDTKEELEAMNDDPVEDDQTEATPDSVDVLISHALVAVKFYSDWKKCRPKGVLPTREQRVISGHLDLAMEDVSRSLTSIGIKNAMEVSP